MNKKTFRNWKKTHPEGTVHEWLASRTDKRPIKIVKRKKKLDRVSKLYGDKKRFNEEF
jgi:hypothetical protein